MLTISKVSKTFQLNEKPLSVLRDINLTVNPGEVVAVLGMSGCGKSTLLKIIAGLLAPDCGQILLKDEPINSPTPEIGIVFQNYTAFPWMSVIKNIESGLIHSNINTVERKDRAKQFLDLVGLSEFADVWPSTLSGGMQQRVALARTYAMNPKILLMDEPFGALDSLTRRVMQREFLHIHSSQRKATIFVTHDIDEALTVGDRIVFLSLNPARIIAEFPNPKNYNTEKIDEESRNDLKNKISTVFRTFEDISSIMSGLTPDISDDVNKVVYVDAIRKQIVNDDALAKQVVSSLRAWDNMLCAQKQYIANLLLGVIANSDSHRKEILDFTLMQFKKEHDITLKVQLIFTAFHAGGGILEYEDKLVELIGWIENHLNEFDAVCNDYYGSNREEAIKKLEKRLEDPIYGGSLPLYLFNLRSFFEYRDSLAKTLEKYDYKNRKTVKEAVYFLKNYK